MKKFMIIALAVLVVIGFAIFAYMQLPMFGKLPSGERLERVRKSKHFRNGTFHNLNHTPVMTENVNYFKMMKNFIFSRPDGVEPIDNIPAIKTDLKNLDRNKDVMIWFGHSSYFIQIDSKRFLIDPVLRESASPVPFTVKAFKGASIYKPEDIPDIDYLMITHDHWDHLDYESVTHIKDRAKHVVCPLGVGETLEYWGIDKSKLIEKEWYEFSDLGEGFTVTSVPTRHFSGRSTARNKTLWTAYALQTPTMKIYIGGDGGYDTHFAAAGAALGPFDLAILENGQFNQDWKYIHTMPEEVVRAANDLGAKMLFPVHSAKFALAYHTWREPLERVSKLSENASFRLLTPIIGEPVNLKDSTQKFKQWWNGVR